jgi:hypothetical protein
MSRQQVLQQVIAVTLVMLFLAECGGPAATQVAEAPAATSTPGPPAATPTPVPPTATPTPELPTATPTPSLTDFGQAATFDGWQMKVISRNHIDNITALSFSFQADEGYTVYLVELEMKNTADAESTLTVNPQKIEVIDAKGRAYESLGGAPGGGTSTFTFHAYQTSGSVSIEGPAMSFTATAKDEKTKEWTIKLSGKSSGRLTVGFVVPKDAQVKELHWPELTPFSLDVLSTPKPTTTSVEGAAEPLSLEGTTWAGIVFDTDTITFEFLEGGALQYTVPSGTYTNGTWIQEGNSIYIEMNNKFTEFEGTIDGNRMSGTARNKNGMNGTWSVEKQ